MAKRELVVTPKRNYIAVSSDDMKFNLEQTLASANARNRRAKLRMQRKMNLRIHPFFARELPLVFTPMTVTNGLASAISTVASKAPEMAIGMLGGEVINRGMKNTLGYTWGEGINLLTRLPVWLADFTNPGYWAAGLAKPLSAALSIGENAFNSLKERFLKNPLPNYDFNTILKSNFYKQLVTDYGKEQADHMATIIASPKFRKYFLKPKGSRLLPIIDANKRHVSLMQTILLIEDAGGLLSGSGRLALEGTVNRSGLLHDLDFNVPGNMTEGTTPILNRLTGWSPMVYRRPVSVTGTIPIEKPNLIRHTEYTTYPIKKDGYAVDLFIRDKMPTRKEIPLTILAAKKLFKRAKDLRDLAAFKPYSAENPMIDVTTGLGLWNPTLFRTGFLTREGYPQIITAETYPGSGIKVPVVMNSRGQIRTIPTKLQKITPENAASITPEQWTAAQDAAIARGDMAEAQRLRVLHFMAKTPNNKLIKESGEPFVMKHYGNKWTEFDPNKTTDGVLWNADENTFKSGEIITFEKEGLPTEWKNLFINMEKPVYDDVTNYTSKLLSRARDGSEEATEELFKTYGVSKPDGLVKKLKLTEDTFVKNGIDVSAEELQHLKDIGVYGKEAAMSVAPYPNKIKLADAVTYDDNGVRIPLGERDNFGINDIRYGLLPFAGITGAATLHNKSNK